MFLSACIKILCVLPLTEGFTVRIFSLNTNFVVTFTYFFLSLTSDSSFGEFVPSSQS